MPTQPGPMTIFRWFEEELIDILCKDHLSEKVRRDVKANAVFLDLDQTGVGYFLTAGHDDLPTGRIVCDTPMVHGTAAGIPVGFVIFLEDRELTIECFSYEASVPDDYRDRNILLSWT